jgi:hypothetical protein
MKSEEIFDEIRRIVDERFLYGAIERDRDTGDYEIEAYVRGAGEGDKYSVDDLANLTKLCKTSKVEVERKPNEPGCEHCGFGANHILLFRFTSPKLRLDE